MNRRMRFQEIFDPLALVSRKVVGDYMDFFAARLIDHDVGEEGGELGEGVPLRPAGGERQHWIFAIQGPNMSLFIDTEHRGVPRGFRYRPMMSAAFFSKSGPLLFRRCLYRALVSSVPPPAQICHQTIS